MTNWLDELFEQFLRERRYLKNHTGNGNLLPQLVGFISTLHRLRRAF